MAKSNVHTTYSKEAGNWRNVSEGASKPNRVFDTKAEAQAAGRQTATNKRVEHLIHNQDGKIAQRNSYGNDPRKSEG